MYTLDIAHSAVANMQTVTSVSVKQAMSEDVLNFLLFSRSEREVAITFQKLGYVEFDTAKATFYRGDYAFCAHSDVRRMDDGYGVSLTYFEPSAKLVAPLVVLEYWAVEVKNGSVGYAHCGTIGFFGRNAKRLVDAAYSSATKLI